MGSLTGYEPTFDVSEQYDVLCADVRARDFFRRLLDLPKHLPIIVTERCVTVGYRSGLVQGYDPEF